MQKPCRVGQVTQRRAGLVQDSEYREQNSRLHEAAERGDVEAIERWIKAGAQVKTRGPGRECAPLLKCVRRRMCSLTRICTQVNARGPGLWSALHMAARYGHADAAERLVLHGAHLEQRSRPV